MKNEHQAAEINFASIHFQKYLIYPFISTLSVPFESKRKASQDSLTSSQSSQSSSSQLSSSSSSSPPPYAIKSFNSQSFAPSNIGSSSSFQLSLPFDNSSSVNSAAFKASTNFSFSNFIPIQTNSLFLSPKFLLHSPLSLSFFTVSLTSKSSQMLQSSSTLSSNVSSPFG